MTKDFGPEEFWRWGELISEGLPTQGGELWGDDLFEEFGNIDDVVIFVANYLTQSLQFSWDDTRAVFLLAQGLIVRAAFGPPELYHPDDIDPEAEA